jgi:hypothetical protein
MRSILVAVALLLAVAAFADPIPCISLNGRAYVPMSHVGITQAPAQSTRTMCGTDFVWVRTVAEVRGGNLQWSGRQVELRAWDGYLLHSFRPLPPHEFWRSAQVKEAYPGLIAAAAGSTAPHVGSQTHQVRTARRQPLSAADARTAALFNRYLLNEAARIDAMVRDAEGALWMSSH